MYDNEYAIMMTEDGPVLCHGLFGIGNKNDQPKERKEHKYLDKIVDGGKTIYFYTQQEIDNYYGRGKQAVKNLGDKLGFDERQNLQKANASNGLFSGSKQRKAQEAYNQTALGKAENAVRGLGNRASGVWNGAKDTAGNLGNKAASMWNGAKNAANNLGDKLGLDERQRLQEANNSKGLFSGSKQRKAQEAYDQTALGKAEKAVRGTADTVKNAGSKSGEKVKNLTDAAKSFGAKKLGELGDAAEGAKSKASNAVGNVVEAAKGIRGSLKKEIDSATGAAAKDEKEQAKLNALMGLDDSIGAYADAQAAYEKTLSGKSESAIQAAKDKMDDAKDGLQEAIGAAKAYLPDDMLGSVRGLFKRKK